MESGEYSLLLPGRNDSLTSVVWARFGIVFPCLIRVVGGCRAGRRLSLIAGRIVRADARRGDPIL